MRGSQAVHRELVALEQRILKRAPDFKKQANGTWKVIVDIWNSDLPVPTSSPAPGAAERK